MADETTLKIKFETNADETAKKLDKVGESAKKAGSSVSGAAKASSAMRDSFGAAAQGAELLGANSDMLSKSIGKVSMATQIFTGVQKVFNTVMSMNPIGAVITALGLLAAAFAMIITKFEILTKAVSFVSGLFTKLVDAISGVSVAQRKNIDMAEKQIKEYDKIDTTINKNINTLKNRIKIMESEGATEKKVNEQKMSLIALEIAKRQEQVLALETLQKANQTLTDDQLKQMAQLKQEMEGFQTDAIVMQNDTIQKQKDADKEAANARLEAQKSANEQLLAAEQAHSLAIITNEKERALAAVEIEKQNAYDKIEALKVSEETKGKLWAAAVQKAQDDVAKIEQADGEKKAAADKVISDKRIADYQSYLDQKRALDQQEAILKADDLDKDRIATEQAYANDLVKYQELLAAKTLSQEEYDQLVLDRKEVFDQQIIDVDTETAAKKKDISDKEDKDKEDKNKKEVEDRKKTAAAALEISAQFTGAMMDFANMIYENKRKGLVKGSKEDVEMQKKQFKTNKALQLVMAVINGAQAVLASLSYGGPIGIIFAALAGVAAGFQIVKIASSKFEPDMGAVSSDTSAPATEKPVASKFAKGGLLSGPSHAAGGIKTRFGELEGGEAVINKRSTMMYGGMLSAINTIGGGKSFASGGNLGGEMADFTAKTAAEAPPVKTYVVASDMSSAQEANFKLKNLSRL